MIPQKRQIDEGREFWVQRFVLYPLHSTPLRPFDGKMSTELANSCVAGDTEVNR
jgi:hypothetical protein